MTFRFLLTLCLLALPLAGVARAQSASFDLAGPRLRATVARGGVTLPIGQVPELAAGDRLTLSADLPADQLHDQLVVVAFLRGASSPPPKKWFVQIKPDKRKPGGSTIAVPEGARQAVVLLAPDVGGGFGALVSAVRGRPGVFVRASQDLGQASLDRARLEAFLDGVHAIEGSSSERLDTASPVLARSLAIRWNADCLQRQPNLQAACLTQNREALILHDGRSATLAETLTGAPAELAYRVSATPQGGSGFYNPYIGLVRDVARLLGGSRSPQYQYIPALAFGRTDTLGLLLNTAPSFRKPHSVLVAPLPPVRDAEPPVIRASAPDAVACAARPDAVLPIEGAPLLYATGFARNMRLRVATKHGGTVELPVEADARRGGIVLTRPLTQSFVLDPMVDATLHGDWGFASFSGPRFRLQGASSSSWLAPETAALVVGRENEMRLEDGAAACVEAVSIGTDAETARAIGWKAAGPRSLALTLPLQNARAGNVSLWIRQCGEGRPVQLKLRSYEEASRVDGFLLHAGDSSGVLTGARLDQVASVTLNGAVFAPGKLERVGGADRLSMVARDDRLAADLKPGTEEGVRIALKDGRSLSRKVVIAGPRPRVALVDKNAERPVRASPVVFELTDMEAMPVDATIVFSLQAQGDTRFSGRETVEVATAGGSVSTTLKTDEGLTVADAQTLVARIGPGALGPSAFGPLRFRIAQGGVAGDWQPLATLVRLPSITATNCDEKHASCTLNGSDFHLIEAIASDPSFRNAVQVPRGFTGGRLTVPSSGERQLFVKLRDAPQAITKVVLLGREPAPAG